MMLADKIALLRKQHGMSQEELADKLDVTRQSISKWESGQSVPDLPKILQLSQLFGVSTDYLLKDDNNNTTNANIVKKDINTTNKTKVTAEQAEQYIQHSKFSAKMYALGVALCVLSPILLILLFTDGIMQSLNLSIGINALIGLIVLFVFICGAVSVFIYTSFKNKKYIQLDLDTFELDNEARAMITKLESQYLPRFASFVIIGVVLCILSAVPSILFALLWNNYIGIGVSITLVIADIAIVLFVYGGVRWNSIQKLLQVGEYSAKGKANAKILEKVSAIYWPLVLAVYFIYSFVSNDWGRSWIVWPIAAVLFAVVSAVTEAIAGVKLSQKRNENNMNNKE